MLKAKAGTWCLVLLPRRSLAASYAAELHALLKPLDIPVESFYSGTHFEITSRKVVRILTPRALVEILAQPRWPFALETLRLVICENLELLDAEYELAISLLLHAAQREPVRFVGVSASLTDASGLADWLNVPPHSLCCFRASDREQDLRTIIQSFTIPHSGALFKAMAKPAHAAISSAAGEPALVFVPSRGQCRAIANDLITRCLMDLKMQGYLPPSLTAESLDIHLYRLEDETLTDFITRGIGIYHDGLSKSDRALMLEMYAEGIVRVLIVPREAMWSVPLRAGVVIVMGTQYIRLEGPKEKADRQVKDYSLAEIFHMQGRAVRHAQSGRFYLFCQSEHSETLTRFLNEGIPLESLLHESFLQNWLRESWKRGNTSVPDKQQTMDILSWTYLTRRLESNPIYYDADPDAIEMSLSRIVDRLHDLHGS